MPARDPWLLCAGYPVLRRSADAGSTSVLTAVLAIFAFLDVPIIYKERARKCKLAATKTN